MKICRYCGEQIKAEAVKCRYCGEFVGNPVRVTQAADIEIKVERRPAPAKIEPRKFISPDRILVIQVLCVMGVISFLIMHFMERAGAHEAFGLLALASITTYLLSFLLFSVMLRRFSGTGRIANPLLIMAIMYAGAFVFLIPLAGAGTGSGSVANPIFLILLLVVAPIITGFIFFLIAGARMIKAKSEVLPLSGLGYTIVFSSAAFIIIRGIVMALQETYVGTAYLVAGALNSLNTLIAVSPLIALFISLSVCRKRLPKDMRGVDILEAENNNLIQ